MLKRLLRLLTWFVPMPLGWSVQQVEDLRASQAKLVSHLEESHRIQLVEQCRRDAMIAERHIREVKAIVGEVVDRYAQTQYLQQTPSQYAMNLIFDVRLLQGMNKPEHMSLIADQLCDRIRAELVSGRFLTPKQQTAATTATNPNPVPFNPRQ